jgi:hypothetical protein
MSGVIEEKIILSLAIFSHGCEEFGSELPGPELDFYTNKVRVFSRACVPGIPSATSASTHLREIADIMRACQTNNTIKTREILDSHMTSIKPKYISSLSSYKNPTLIEHQDKSCNVSTFLHNKTFHFEDPENARINSDDNFGIFVVDIRKQINDNGNIRYESIFNPGSMRSISDVKYYNLIDQEAMKNFINGILKKRKTKSEIRLLYNNFFSGNTTNLIQIYNFCIACGIDLLNILDNSCRECSQGMPPLNPSSTAEIYDREQSVIKPEFGGKKSKKSKKLIKKSKRYRSKKRTRRNKI